MDSHRRVLDGDAWTFEEKIRPAVTESHWRTPERSVEYIWGYWKHHEVPKLTDWMVERGEFELPVPICEQSDDSIRLSFATSRRTAKRYRPAAHF